jgi:anti-sigma B factor antagonist
MTISGSIFSIRTVEGADVVEFNRPDVVDGVEIKQAGDEIYHYLKERDGIKLVLDFHRVEHLSSAALGMIVALNRVIGQRAGQLRVAAVNDDLQKVFKLMRLHKLVTITKTTDDAIESFD